MPHRPNIKVNLPYENTILIVDDEFIIIDLLKTILEQVGYNIISTERGNDAFKIAKEIFPDVILLDVNLPDSDGFTICEQIRNDDLICDTPVIIMTGLSNHDSLLRALEVGADDFILKPIDSVEILARINRITKLNRNKKLLNERRRFERVIEKSDIGYILIDGYDNLLFSNKMACKYLSISIDEIKKTKYKFLDIAKRIFNLEPNDYWNEWPDEQREIKRYLVKPEKEGEDAFWLEIDIVDWPSILDNTWIISLKDVSSKLSQRIEIQEFHQMILHKLRTPLVSTLGGMELLAISDSVDLNSSEIIELSQGALKNLQRLHHEIEDIVNFVTSPEINKKGNFIPLKNLKTICDDLSDELDLKLNISEKIQGFEDHKILLNDMTSEIILSELFENSKKFHPERTPKIDVNIEVIENDKILLSVGDDGVNLSTEQLSKVWQPYYQGEKIFTGEIDGMGLGLATIASIIWGIGGKCKMYNREDQTGLVVELLIPFF